MRSNFFGLNIIDWAIILIVLLFGLIGRRKGLMKSLVGVVSLMASVIIAWILYPVVSDILSGIGVKEFVAGRVFSGLENIGTAEASQLALPKFAADVAERAQTTVNTSVSGYVAGVVVSIASFIFILIITRVIIQIGLKVLNIFSKLPVVSTLNRLMGFCAGSIKGMIIVYLAITIIFVIVPAEAFRGFEDEVEASIFVSRISSKNPVESIFMKNSVNENGE